MRWLAPWACLTVACSAPAQTRAVVAPHVMARPSARPAEASSTHAGSSAPETLVPPHPDAAPPPEPLVTALELPDVPPPILVLPSSADPIPLLIGAHGAGGSPEWQCQWLASLMAEPAALLCLRGLPLSRGELAYYYPEHHSLGRWLAAALERVTNEHAPRLEPSFVYVAYSQGATMGALAIQTAANVIPNLLLVEGGLDGWSLARSQGFARAGGRKVYFACGTRSCNTKARKLLETLTQAGLEARLGYAEGAGHTPGGAVELYVREGLAWLLENDSAQR